MEKTGNYRLPEDLKARLEIETSSNDRLQVLKAVIKATLPAASQAIIWHNEYKEVSRATYENVFYDVQNWE